MRSQLTGDKCLPVDRAQATLVGRVFSPAEGGPVQALVRDDALFDLSRIAPTAQALFELDDPVRAIRAAGPLPKIGDLPRVLANSSERERDGSAPWLLAPNDLQAIKASGVTFVASMLERVIEEQARGDARKAESVRQSIVSIIGSNLRDLRPGSPQARAVKAALIAQGV